MKKMMIMTMTMVYKDDSGDDEVFGSAPNDDHEEILLVYLTSFYCF